MTAALTMLPAAAETTRMGSARSGTTAIVAAKGRNTRRGRASATNGTTDVAMSGRRNSASKACRSRPFDDAAGLPSSVAYSNSNAYASSMSSFCFAPAASCARSRAARSSLLDTTYPRRASRDRPSVANAPATSPGGRAHVTCEGERRWRDSSGERRRCGEDNDDDVTRAGRSIALLLSAEHVVDDETKWARRTRAARSSGHSSIPRLDARTKLHKQKQERCGAKTSCAKFAKVFAAPELKHSNQSCCNFYATPPPASSTQRA